MQAIATFLIVVGLTGIIMATMMFGDIGIAAAIAALTAILSGIGFFLVNNRLPKP